MIQIQSGGFAAALLNYDFTKVDSTHMPTLRPKVSTTTRLRSIWPTAVL